MPEPVELVNLIYSDLLVKALHRRTNFKTPPDLDKFCTVSTSNVLCGDSFVLYVKLEHSRVAEAFFSGSGCALMMAAGSLMTEQVRGWGLDRCQDEAQRFREFLAGSEELDQSDSRNLFRPLIDYERRRSCAFLPWKALEAVCAKL